ncbi:hypothetical protein AB7M32_003337 [Pseudomonas sp. R151218B TE3479]
MLELTDPPPKRVSLLPLGSVGAGEACDLLIFRLRLKWLGKDRSLAPLDSSYRAPQPETIHER